MIDSHVHLDADQYPDPSATIKRALEAGVTAIVVPGTGGESNRRVMELSRRFPNVVYPACGYHPERLELTDADLEDALAMIHDQHDSVCAVGEVGMPWYGDRARQPAVVARAKQVLSEMCRAAADADLAVIVHAPHDSAREALEILKVTGVRQAVFHWHKSDDATTRAILDAGYFISITPEVAYRDRDQHLARLVPLDKMLLETDGPWPFSGPFEGSANEPTLIVETAGAIGRILNVPKEMVASTTAANARMLFRIPSAPRT
jgi:TatD DNase family protein